MVNWLHDRFMALENPHEDLYYPRFGTFNWIRSLAILSDRLNAENVRQFYRDLHIARRARTAQNVERIDTETYGCLFLSMQYYAGLREIENLKARRKEILARLSIVDWYYGLYWAANAMLLAQTGEHPEIHSPAARQWCTEFSMRGWIPEPFSFHVTTLVEQDCDAEIDRLGETSNAALTRTVSTRKHARENCLGSLRGTAEWNRKRKMDEIRDSREFKLLGVENFRKKVARNLRDGKLSGENCGLLHQAFRARGKANYRDALYFGYGDSEQEACVTLIEDLRLTLEKFLLSAATFCRMRVQRNTWDDFMEDIESTSWFEEKSFQPLADVL